jgi:HPt (histidine-containing phosphotransfer) domain-containing protein
MTANVSARRLSQAASEIEMSLKQSSTDIPHSLIGRLEQEAERLQSLLTAQFPDIFTYREAPRTDNVSEIISEETKARLPEIIYRLEHEFLPVWKELCAVYYVDDIEAFAAKIGQFACEFHIGFLADYSKRLSEQVKCCNIIEMEKLMTEFQELVQKIIR